MGWKMVVVMLLVRWVSFLLVWYCGLGLYFLGLKVVSVGCVMMWCVRCRFLVVIWWLVLVLR